MKCKICGKEIRAGFPVCGECIEADQTLAGVMHFVDKFFDDGDPALSLDPVNRAMAMRDRVLSETERLEAYAKAAIADMKPHHSRCKHGSECTYISAVTGFPDCVACEEWEWRGPTAQEGEKEHGE